MTKILVVEDEEFIRTEVIDWLRFEGYDVMAAADGRTGLELAQEGKPDLILCDISMPHMSGHDVLVEVRSRTATRRTPFIFLTASAERESMRKAMELGADDYLTKPFTHDEVMQAIEARLQQLALRDAEIVSQQILFNSALSQEREKLLLKSRLVAMLSHDFRNALALVQSASSILRNYRERLSPARYENQLDLIDGSVHLLVQMLDDMLVMAELDEGHLAYAPEQTDLRELTERIVHEASLIYWHTHRITLSCDVEESATVDPKLYRHILVNLVSNAVKYSPADGVVAVELHVQPGGFRLTVSDAGIGIPEEAIPKLFDPFFRATNVKDTQGTGLGLPIVRQAVELHGGRIEIDSVLNHGTRFAVFLPQRPQAEENHG